MVACLKSCWNQRNFLGLQTCSSLLFSKLASSCNWQTPVKLARTYSGYRQNEKEVHQQQITEWVCYPTLEQNKKMGNRNLFHMYWKCILLIIQKYFINGFLLILLTLLLYAHSEEYFICWFDPETCFANILVHCYDRLIRHTRLPNIANQALQKLEEMFRILAFMFIWDIQHLK